MNNMGRTTYIPISLASTSPPLTNQQGTEGTLSSSDVTSDFGDNCDISLGKYDGNCTSPHWYIIAQEDYITYCLDGRNA
jgi:hypothetical protein